MSTLSILLGVCIWVLGSCKLEAHGALMGYVEFCSLAYDQIIALLFLFAWCNHWLTCYTWKNVQWPSHQKVTVGFTCTKCLFNSIYIYAYIVGTFINYINQLMSPFSRLPLVCIHLFISIKFSDIGSIIS